jgi:cobalt/nickel transport system permease protein
MHIPDGFLDTKTIVATGMLSVAGIAMALRRTKVELPASRLPLMGVGAAFIFATQMINFPVIGGTSGHLIGAVLAAVLMGPSPAVLVMSSVLIVQCFLFADGGLLALGANILNMAILAPLVGSAVYTGVHTVYPGRRGILTAAGFAAWFSTVVAAIACGGELAVSGTVPWNTGIPAMANIHMLIGVGEALITMLILAAILTMRPDLIEQRKLESAPRNIGAIVAYSLIITIVIALFVSPFASTWPDGLERVAAALGFGQKAVVSTAQSSPLADYKFPGLSSPIAATAIAGLFGTIASFVFAIVLARLIGPRERKP